MAVLIFVQPFQLPLTEEGMCSCYHGYWGSSCQYACPGGSHNPCYGNGDCGLVDGQCTCNAHFTRSDDCQSCNPDYLGTDCSVAVRDLTLQSAYHVASVVSYGMTVTFDGAAYLYNQPGEHRIFSTTLVDGTPLAIHARFRATSGVRLVTGVDAIAVNCGRDVLEIYSLAPSGNAGGYVLINSHERLLRPGILLQNRLECAQFKPSQYHLTSPQDDLDIQILLSGGFLSIHVQCTQILCHSSTGLLSSCNGDPTDDFVAYNGTELDATGPNATLSQSNLHETFGLSYLVPVSQTQFSLHQDIDYLTSGSSVYLMDSSYQTSSLCTFSNSDITIELKFKASQHMTSCGSLFSYKGPSNVTSVTLLLCDHRLVISYRDQQVSTGWTVSSDTWYHVSLVWQPSNNQILLFTVHNGGSLLSEVFRLTNTGSHNLFEPCGQLWLGQWIPDSWGTSARLTWNFQGWINAVRIWNKRLSSSEVMLSAWSAVYYDEQPYLANHWVFNEAYGGVAVDTVHRLTLASSNYKPWTRPLWSMETGRLTSSLNDNLRSYKLPEDIVPEFLSQSEEFCASIISSTISQFCGSVQLENSFLTMYRELCVSTAVLRGAIHYTLPTTYGLAQDCVLLNNPTVIYDAIDWVCGRYNQVGSPDLRLCTSGCQGGRFERKGSELVCVCEPGFWGERCQNICQARCSQETRHCSSMDGQCECTPNWDQLDCDRCEDGWYGPDCSSALSQKTTNGTHYMCQVSSQSSFVMFDGQTYSLERPGEYLLFDADPVAVYGRTTPCAGDKGTCFTQTGLALSSGDNFVIRRPFTNSIHGFNVWKNGEHLVFSTSWEDSDIKIEYMTESFLNVSIAGLTIHVKSFHYLLTLEVLTKAADCVSNQGLCGNCDSNPDNDFVLESGLPIPHNSITAEIINGEFAALWTLTPGTDFGFIYSDPSDLYRENPGMHTASHALQFIHTSCQSDLIDSIINSGSETLSLEWKFRLLAGASGEDVQTIISYVSQTSSMSIIVKSGTLWIQLNGGTEEDLGLVPAMSWQHITMVYHTITGVATIYQVTQDDDIHMASVAIGTGQFRNRGVIGLGQDGILPESGTSLKPNTYHGLIADVRLWNRGFDQYEAILSAKTQVDASFSSLVLLWEFSEGAGSIAKDTIYGIRIRLPAVGGPAWILSGALVMVSHKAHRQTEPDVTWYTNRNPDLADHCHRLTRAVYDMCSTVGESFWMATYLSCLRDIHFIPHTTSALPSITALADYCSVLEDVNIGNSSLCDDPSLKEETLCQPLESCRFGEWSDGQCLCKAGYFGEDCSKECPGNVSNPCHNNGMCTQEVGDCICDAGWDPHTDCSTCLEGWSGPHCSILAPVKPTTNDTTEPETLPHTASIYGFAHIFTFQGSAFSLSQLGEFYLLQYNEDLEIQVLIGICYNERVCIRAIALRYLNHEIVIRAGYTTDHIPIVWYNQHQQDTPISAVFMGSFLVKQTSTYSLSISHNMLGRLELTIRQVYRQLTVSLHADYILCASSYPQNSLLGSCNPDMEDVLDSSGSSYLVPHHHSLFGVLYIGNDYGEKNITTGAGFGLYLDGQSLVSTDDLIDTFTPLQDCTVEFHFNPETPHGVLITYSTNTLFSVYLNVTLRLRAGNEAHDTGLVIHPHSWHHVYIVWEAASRSFTVYLAPEGHLISYITISVSGRTFFQSQGLLVIGQWLGTDSRLPVYGLQGHWDELRIWRRIFSYTEVIVHQKSNYLQRVPGLIAMWKFNEGEGDRCRDYIGSAHMHFIHDRFSIHKPVWRFSHAQLDLCPIRMTSTFPNEDLAVAAAVKCRHVLTSLPEDCVSEQQMLAAEASCMVDIAGGQSSHMALHIVLALSDMCFLQGLTAQWPAAYLCTEFPAGHFPVYVGSNCQTECKFGQGDTLPGLGCHCHHGFWGDTCTNVCPGGARQPCAKHGVCSQDSGQCICEPNWTGDDICSSCSQGRQGTDCSLYSTEPTGQQYVLAVASGGHWRLLDGSAISFAGLGIFRLLQSGGFEIQIAQSSCQSHRVCVTLLGIRIAQSSLIFDLGHPSSGFRIYHNDNPLIVIDTKEVEFHNNYYIQRQDMYQYKITGPDGLYLVITIQLASMDFTLSIDTCDSQIGGLAGPCTPQLGHQCKSEDMPCLTRALGLTYFSTHYHLTQEVTEQHCHGHHVPFFQSIFVTVTGLTWGQQWGIHITQDPAISQVLEGEFDHENLTIEIALVIQSLNGSIFSYTNENQTNVMIQLAVVQGYLCLHYGNNAVLTSIAVQLNIRSHLSLLYNQHSGRLTLVYITSDIKVWHGIISRNVITRRGVVTLGGCLSPTEPMFKGTFLQIRAWKNMLSVSRLLYHSQVHLPYINKELVLRWPFKEGHGQMTSDVTGRNVIYLPGNTWTSQLPWTQQAFVYIQYDCKIDHNDNTSQDLALATCSSVFLQGSLHSHCGQLHHLISFHYQACLLIVAGSRDPDTSLGMVLTASQVCQSSVGLSDCPTRLLCNNFPTANFPLYIGSQCDRVCVFGRANPTDNNQCDCVSGYWGSSCDRLCPGGLTPCSGHGSCGNDGFCYCHPHWMGKHCQPCTLS